MSAITIDVNSEIAIQAQAVLEKLDLDLATVVNLVLQQIVTRREIPFAAALDAVRKEITVAPEKDISDDPWGDIPLVIPLGEPDYTEEQILAMQEFEARTGEKALRPPIQFGCWKGLIHVPDDFNEPLDIFKEYMP